MNSPFRWGWLTSRRFVRVATALVVPLALGLILYNATIVDRVPPSATISLSKVEPGGSAALTLTTILVNFSENVQVDTAEQAFSVTPTIEGSFSWKGSGSQELIFTPKNKLPLHTQYTVRVSPGVKDLAGNAQSAEKTYQFTTVSAPIVKSVSPASGAADVPVTSTIQITFDRFMQPDAVVNALKIDPSVGLQPSWSGAVLTLTPSADLAFATTYTVSISGTAVDTDGNNLPAYETSFKTVGKGLNAQSTIPAPNVAGVSTRTPIAVIFDGPIDPNSIAGSFQITPPVSGDTKAVPLPDDSKPAGTAAPAARVLTFTPSQPLAAHTTYTVTLKAGVRRTDGQSAESKTWTFTTGEAPTTAQNQIVFMSDRAGVSNLWLMNPDGSNPRQITTELVPVAGYDVSSDGAQIVYTAGGLVKQMTLANGNVTTLTTANRFEYAPAFTPDGSAVIVGRRDATGADQGYWLITLGGGEKQIVDSGAPGLGSVTLSGDGLTDSPGRTSWASAVAFSKDGQMMLMVRGDKAVELVDLTGAQKPVKLGLTAAGVPTYTKTADSFFVVAQQGGQGAWGYWRVDRTGKMTRLGDAVGELAGSGTGELAVLVAGADGSVHLNVVVAPGGTEQPLTIDASLADRSPAFSPDGGTIVFARVYSANTVRSGGIWIVKADGTGLANLATDGAFPRWLP